MHDLLPDGENVRRAVKWISGMIQDHPEKSVLQLVDEAMFKFDLSPRDASFLSDFFKQSRK